MNDSERSSDGDAYKHLVSRGRHNSRRGRGWRGGMGKVFLRKGIGMSSVKVKVGRIPRWLRRGQLRANFSKQKPERAMYTPGGRVAHPQGQVPCCSSTVR